MDTSSPWDGEGAGGGASGGGWADFSTASQEETHGGDGWADFGAMAEEAPPVADAPPLAGGFAADFASSADGSNPGDGGNNQGKLMPRAVLRILFASTFFPLPRARRLKHRYDSYPVIFRQQT